MEPIRATPKTGTSNGEITTGPKEIPGNQKGDSIKSSRRKSKNKSIPAFMIKEKNPKVSIWTGKVKILIMGLMNMLMSAKTTEMIHKLITPFR